MLLKNAPKPEDTVFGPALNPETVKSIPTDMLLDFLAVQLNGPKADGKHIVI